MSMKRIWRWSVILAGVVALIGCAFGDEKHVAPEPAKMIDVSRFYTGRWYEIARTPMKLTDGCVAGTTDYVPATDGGLIERDACHDGTPEGKEEMYQGPVTILNPSENTKTSVRYTVWGVFPVWRTYWMLDHGDDYAWFIVSDPEFKNVSMFTRSPRPSTSDVESLTKRAHDLGYDTSKLEYPAQFPPGEQ
jgi:apolipoprotein D and lipocalin family protein